MNKADIPQDEKTRLEALRSVDVLDTLPDERFDRLTRMAKRMFGVPIALVSLVDENRQWFKSCIGLDASETSRDISFCGQPINDKYGHTEGDRILITFASQMKSSLRDSDLFARLGGDEFVVLLSNTSKQQAEQIMVRFNRSLKKFNQEANRGDVHFAVLRSRRLPERYPAPWYLVRPLT